jgi:hypothetical protein
MIKVILKEKKIDFGFHFKKNIRFLFLIILILNMKTIEKDINNIELNKLMDFDIPYQWLIDNNLIFRMSELEKYEER